MEESEMKSNHGDEFNHDPYAAGYDADVRQEDNPIRAGYGAVQAWLGQMVAENTAVLDLGCGTGNTLLALPASCRLTAVDISHNMITIAREKLSERDVTYHISDILHYVHTADLHRFDVVVSCYALHHLLDEEKLRLFDCLQARMKRNGRLLIGDLMLKNEPDRQRILDKYTHSHPDLAEAFAEEFFWPVDEMEQALSNRGWQTEWRRFSDLSWTVAAWLP
jgi:putative AdoMet-dependent methyltransferase